MKKVGICADCGAPTGSSNARRCRDCWAKSKQRPGCIDCGGPVTHSKAKRCQPCFKASRQTAHSLRMKEHRTCERPGCDSVLNQDQKQFCSPQCRNAVLNPIKGPTMRRVDQKGIRKPGRIWSASEEEFLVTHFPDHGPDWVAEKLGKTRSQTKIKARSLKLQLTKEARQRLIIDPIAERMKASNPSHMPGASEWLSRKARLLMQDPEFRRKLSEGQAKVQRGKPSGLELKVVAILDSIGVAYEPHAVLKARFVVDFRIGSLVIEADGDWWHGHPRFEPLIARQVAQQKRDVARGKYLATCGYTVVRIWESDTTEDAIRRILAENKQAAGSPVPARPTRARPKQMELFS